MLTDTLYAMPRWHLETMFRSEAKLAAMEAPPASALPFKTEGQTAVIAVDGILFPKPNILTLFGFGMPLTDIRMDLELAANSPAVNKIVFNFNSPGGSVTGIHELANAIKAVKKPTVAYVSGMAASAAYWLAAACDEIVTDATAVMGSIGVIGVFRAGDKNEIEIVSSSAPDKRPDAKTPEGKRVLQREIDDLETVFIQSIAGLRSSLSVSQIKALRGGVEIGAKAVHAGLADGLGSLQGVLDGQPAVKPDGKQGSTQNQGDWSKAIARARGHAVFGRKVEPETSPPVVVPDQNVRQTDIAQTVPVDPKANYGWKAAFAKARR